MPIIKTGHCYDTIPFRTVIRRSDPYQPFRRRSVSEGRFYISFQDIFHILAIQYTHIPTGFVFTNYRFRPASLPSGSDSRDLLLYDWQAEDLSAALPDQSGINKNKEE